MAYCGWESLLAGALGPFAVIGHSGTIPRVEEVVGAASGLEGLACPPASEAEPVYYGVLPGQSGGVSLRGPVQGGRADEGYPENHPAGGLVHSPPLKSLREHTQRDRMSITSRDKKHTIQTKRLQRTMGKTGVWAVMRYKVWETSGFIKRGKSQQVGMQPMMLFSVKVLIILLINLLNVLD